MVEEIFIPSKRITVLVSDAAMIDEAINCYLDGRKEEMKGFILEYGEEQFFSDLVRYFEAGYWRNPRNKYHLFVGITVSFFKIYT
jgi:hypothetical protein